MASLRETAVSGCADFVLLSRQLLEVRCAVQRDRLAHVLCAHIGDRANRKVSNHPVEFEGLMLLLQEPIVIMDEYARIQNLEQLCDAVIQAQNALEAKQSAIRVLVGSAESVQPGSLELLVIERDELRRACQQERSALLGATNKQEFADARQSWDMRRVCARSALELSSLRSPAAGEPSPLPPHERLRQAEAEASATIATRTETIQRMYELAKQTTDVAASRLSEEFSMAALHLRLVCEGQHATCSNTSISGLQDQLLRAIDDERAVWARAEIDIPFPSDSVLVAGSVLQELSDFVLSTIDSVEVTFDSTRQTFQHDVELCCSAKASEHLESLVGARRQEQARSKDYRRALLDLEGEDRPDASAVQNVAKLRLELLQARREVQSQTNRLAKLAYSDFPELLCGPHNAVLLPVIDHGGLLKEGMSFKDYDEPPVLLPANSRHSVWTALFEGKKVVLKEYMLADKNARQRFSQEVRTLQRLSHPTIVTLSAVFIEPSGRAYIQMPFYDAGNLAEWIANTQPSEHRLQAVLLEVTRAIEHVHNNAVIHGDIKPENIFMETLGNGYHHPRLGDFDLSQDTSGRSLLLSQIASSVAPAMTGTLPYMAPELFLGQAATLFSDIFSLGRTFCFAHFPLLSPTSMSESSLPAHPNDNLVRLLKTMLSVQPSDRPTASEVASAPYFTLSMLVEREHMSKLSVELQSELVVVRATQLKLAEETEAFQRRQQLIAATEARLRADQAKFYNLSMERQAELSGQEHQLTEREQELKRTQLSLLSERNELQEKLKRQAAAEAVLRDQEHRLRDSIASDQQPPLYWSSSSTVYCEHDVTLQMRTRLQKMIDTSCTKFGVGKDLKTPWPSQYKRLLVNRVVRIENPALWRLYSAQRAFVRQNCKHAKMQREHVCCYDDWMTEHALRADCNELYLFHCTTPDAVPRIKQHGFETRLRPGTGRMLGDGAYFAENASKADQYGVPAGTTFYLFVARVCIGAPFKTSSAQLELKRPPETRPCGPLFDSVLYAHAGKHREFVVYDRTACYPEFLIEYKRD